jgi:hypothetical protein
MESYFEFNKKVDYNELFHADLDFFKRLDLKIVKIKAFEEGTSLDEQIEMILHVLEELDNDDSDCQEFFNRNCSD